MTPANLRLNPGSLELVLRGLQFADWEICMTPGTPTETQAILIFLKTVSERFSITPKYSSCMTTIATVAE